MGIVDNEGALVVEYKYDAWGKPISTWTLTAEYQALAVCNPFRYRGYAYDGETGLYYLYNRYYVPLLTRFINPDIVLGVVGKVNSHNAYAYCLNTPILKYDPDGYSAAEALAFFQQAAVADGPLPFGEAIGLIGALWILLRALSDSDAHVQSNSTVREREDDRDDNPTYIYRYGSSTYYNLTPRSTDKGLSFSLVPPADGRAFRTTMEAVNATGVLTAVNDHTTHVSVVPVNYLTMTEWQLTKQTANKQPHYYSVLLLSLAQ